MVLNMPRIQDSKDTARSQTVDTRTYSCGNLGPRPGRIVLFRFAFVVHRRRDLTLPADRLDTVLVAVLINEIN